MMKRKAMTLVELLAVIAIIVTTMALAVPALRPVFSGRKQRETSRMVQAFIKGAQARAAELGRPVGIWIERFNGEFEREAMYSTQIFYAEIPPVYKGDVQGSRAWFFEVDQNLNWVVPSRPTTNTFRVIFSFSTMLDNLVGVGEVFYGRFGTDHLYRIRKTAPGIFLLADTVYPPIEAVMHPYPDNPGPPIIPLPPSQRPQGQVDQARLLVYGDVVPGLNEYGAPFELLLPPRKVTERVLQLPNQMCIDLSSSGIGAIGIDFNPSRPLLVNTKRVPERLAPVVIAFHPEGHIDRVWGPFQFNAAPSRLLFQPSATNQDSWITGLPPTGPIHLLIGSIEQVWPGQGANAWTGNDLFFTSETLNSNVVDSNNYWVTISHRTGIVSTNELGADDPTLTTPQERLYKVREFARTGLGIGGQ